MVDLQSYIEDTPKDPVSVVTGFGNIVLEFDRGCVAGEKEFVDQSSRHPARDRSAPKDLERGVNNEMLSCSKIDRNVFTTTMRMMMMTMTMMMMMTMTMTTMVMRVIATTMVMMTFFKRI